MAERILVTGGAGFIGSHVAEAFLAAGHEVAILDNFSTGEEKNLPAQAQVFRGDVTNRDYLNEVLQQFRPTVLNHHAAHIQVGNSVKDPHFDALHNIFGVLNLMEEAKLLGTVKKVIMASTGGAMYGDQPVPFNESMLPQPLSPYGISKRSGEMYLYFYYAQYGIQFVALRYANVYGPRQNPHGESGVVSIFMEKILAGQEPVINGDGLNTRDYVYVGDVARANVLALQYDGVGEFNIGTGRELSTNEVFHAVVAALQVNVPEKHGPARPGEQIRSALDASKAIKELGWQPTMSFEEGIVQTAAFFQNT